MFRFVRYIAPETGDRPLLKTAPKTRKNLLQSAGDRPIHTDTTNWSQKCVESEGKCPRTPSTTNWSQKCVESEGKCLLTPTKPTQTGLQTRTAHHRPPLRKVKKQ